jgi:hypothetical protein
MKTYRKKTVEIGFTGYTDAPPDIEKEMDRAILVKDFQPPPIELMLKTNRFLPIFLRIFLPF